MTRIGSCPCGAVRYTITGPVRDVIVCHCDACRAAAGGPWRASAARREDFVLAAPGALVWTKAEVSEHDASRGACRECEAYLIWDAPARDTVSFAADTLEGSGDLAVAAHIWVPEGEVVPEPQPVRWHN